MACDMLELGRLAVTVKINVRRVFAALGDWPTQEFAKMIRV
jgi:hypothetical protein